MASELETHLTLRIPQLAGLQAYNHVLVEGDGALTKEGWGALAGLISALVCLWMYKSSRVVTPWFFKSYRGLPKEEQRNWDTRYASNIHSALCVFFAYELLWKSDFFWKEGPVPMILRTSPATHVAMGVSFGYFAVDFVTCVKYNVASISLLYLIPVITILQMGGTEMLLHHLGSLLSVATALATGNGHMHTLWMLFTEFTTPFINNRWWLDKMGMKTHILYVINGLSIVVFWVCARLVIFPPFFVVLWRTRDQIIHITYVSRFLMVCVPVVLSVLNIFWFYKIVQGAYKVLFGKKKEVKAE